MVSQLKRGVIGCSAAAEGVANTAIRDPWLFSASLLWHLCSCSPLASGVTHLLFLHSRCWCAGLLAWLGSISSSTGDTEWSQLSWQLGHSAISYSFHVLVSSMGNVFPLSLGSCCVCSGISMLTDQSVFWCKVCFCCL